MTGEDPPDDDRAIGPAEEPARGSAPGSQRAPAFRSWEPERAFARAIEFAPGPVRSGFPNRGVVSGQGGRDAARVRSVNMEQLISTRTRRGTGGPTVSVTAREKLGSLRRRRSSASP